MTTAADASVGAVYTLTQHGDQCKSQFPACAFATIAFASLNLFLSKVADSDKSSKGEVIG